MRVSIRLARARYEDKHGHIPVMTLAKRVGVSRYTIHRWITGDMRGFNLDTLEKLCRVLDCDVSDIMWMEDNNGGK